MQVAMTRNGERVFAENAIKNIVYRCINCRSEVFLARGEKNRPHFRHFSAKNRQEVLECEYYSRRFIQGSDPLKVHKSELDARMQVRLELCNVDGEWKPYLRFPVIHSKFHSVIDREQLYFQVKCIEENLEFSSVRLLGLTGVYRLPVHIRQSYTIVGNPLLEERFGIKISGVYKPFEKETLLFKFIHGDLLHIPYQNVMLNGRFFLLSKIPLLFPPEIRWKTIQQLGVYNLYELQITENVSSQVIDWFSNELHINLIPLECHLDLLEPVFFRMNRGIVEVEHDCVTVLITQKDTRKGTNRTITPKVRCAKIIAPDERQPEIIDVYGHTFQVSLSKFGLYTIYLLNQRGEMLEIKRVQKVHHDTDGALNVTIDDKHRLFSDSTIPSRNIRLASNCQVTIYPFRGKPYKVRSTEETKMELDDVIRVHVPFVWLFKQQKMLDDALSDMFRILKYRQKFQEVYVGMARFNHLCRFISECSHPQKNHILFLLRMKRGFLPSRSLAILQEMED